MATIGEKKLKLSTTTKKRTWFRSLELTIGFLESAKFFIGSLQVHIRYLTFSSKKPWIKVKYNNETLSFCWAQIPWSNVGQVAHVSLTPWVNSQEANIMCFSMVLLTKESSCCNLMDLFHLVMKPLYVICKSLYGLKPSPCCWNSVLHEYLELLGFKHSGADPSIYVHSNCCVYWWPDHSVCIKWCTDEGKTKLFFQV